MGVGESVPGLTMPGQLRGGQDAEHLVVGLEELAPTVQEFRRPGRVVVTHPVMEDEVVVPPSHGQGVELDRAEPLEGCPHPVEAGRQRAGR